MPPQPAPCSRAAGGQVVHETPEARPVVHLDEVRHLMCNDIIEHRPGAKISRQQNEIFPSPEQLPHRLFVSRTLTRCHFAADLCRQPPRARRELVPRHDDEVVADPACQMCRIAADPDFAINDPDRRQRRGTLAPYPMWNPEHRHDRALDERHRLRQRLQTRRDPFALRR